MHPEGKTSAEMRKLDYILCTYVTLFVKFPIPVVTGIYTYECGAMSVHIHVKKH